MNIVEGKELAVAAIGYVNLAEAIVQGVENDTAIVPAAERFVLLKQRLSVIIFGDEQTELNDGEEYVSPSQVVEEIVEGDMKKYIGCRVVGRVGIPKTSITVPGRADFTRISSEWAVFPEPQARGEAFKHDFFPRSSPETSIHGGGIILREALHENQVTHPPVAGALEVLSALESTFDSYESAKSGRTN